MNDGSKWNAFNAAPKQPAASFAEIGREEQVVAVEKDIETRKQLGELIDQESQLRLLRRSLKLEPDFEKQFFDAAREGVFDAQTTMARDINAHITDRATASAHYQQALEAAALPDEDFARSEYAPIESVQNVHGKVRERQHAEATKGEDIRPILDARLAALGITAEMVQAEIENSQSFLDRRDADAVAYEKGVWRAVNAKLKEVESKIILLTKGDAKLTADVTQMRGEVPHLRELKVQREAARVRGDVDEMKRLDDQYQQEWHGLFDLAKSQRDISKSDIEIAYKLAQSDL